MELYCKHFKIVLYYEMFKLNVSCKRGYHAVNFFAECMKKNTTFISTKTNLKASLNMCIILCRTSNPHVHVCVGLQFCSNLKQNYHQHNLTHMSMTIAIREYMPRTLGLYKAEDVFVCLFVCLFVLTFNVPVNNFSVMSGQSRRFLYINQ